MVERKLELLGSNECLGRDEKSKSQAKRSFRQLRERGYAKVPITKFQPPRDTNEISVNRLDLASKSTLAKIGERNAKLIEKQFWGWYTLTVSDIREVGCNVKLSPLENNPYHADIVVPVGQDAEDREQTIKEYSIDLADRAKFVPWVKRNELTEFER